MPLYQKTGHFQRTAYPVTLAKRLVASQSTTHNAHDSHRSRIQKRLGEKLDQQKEILQGQREQLEEMDLSNEEVERALEPIISFRDGLREEIETYEQMWRGDLPGLHDLRSVGRWLIRAHIAKGWSLSQLADKLDVSVQQVSRDEQNEYEGITTRRAQRILDALGVRFRMEIEEPVLSGEEDREKVTV